MTLGRRPERNDRPAGLLDGGQGVAAGAAVCLTGTRAVAGDLDADATAAAVMTTRQQGP
jgi:hypothetical protein